MSTTRVLALEPYHGGSHQAFLDGWVRRSRHAWDLFTLSPRKWKWRMRGGAVTLARRVARVHASGDAWDVLFCSDMLNLAEFRGLAPAAVRDLPAVVYFHENQLTYPVDHPSDFDYHFAFTNLTTALAADRVWWNSAFHRDSMLEALSAFLVRMPDHRLLDAPGRIREKSEVRPPGIDRFPPRGERAPGPLRILWAARWEADKDPETFFRALDLLEDEGIEFEVSVIGGGDARETPAVFGRARERYACRIRRWGYVEDREDYADLLLESDVIVSTARHEFFGIAVLEGAAAGAFPLVPRRLAYPEVFDLARDPRAQDFFHDGTAEDLARRLAELDRRLGPGREPLRSGGAGGAFGGAARYDWNDLAPRHDRAIENLARLR